MVASSYIPGALCGGQAMLLSVLTSLASAVQVVDLSDSVSSPAMVDTVAHIVLVLGEQR